MAWNPKEQACFTTQFGLANIALFRKILVISHADYDHLTVQKMNLILQSFAKTFGMKRETDIEHIVFDL